MVVERSLTTIVDPLAMPDSLKDTNAVTPKAERV